MWFPPPSAAVIAGRLQFLQSSLSGKVGCMVMHALRQRAAGKDPGPRLVQGTSLTEGLVWIVRCLKRVPPRDVAMCTTRRPVLIFTDGACEEDDGRGVVTVGAVLVLDGSASSSALKCPKRSPVLGGRVCPGRSLPAQEWSTGPGIQPTSRAYIQESSPGDLGSSSAWFHTRRAYMFKSKKGQTEFWRWHAEG